MLTALAVANYRSLRKLVVPLKGLNLIQGPNGSGKSNLYRALSLLKEAALGGCVASIAREGGLSSVLWAGPQDPSKSHPAQAQVKMGPVRLLLGFASDEFSYAVDFGLGRPPKKSLFVLDPHFKRESIWRGCGRYRRSASLMERTRNVVELRQQKWEVVTEHLPSYESALTHLADPERAAIPLLLREELRSWRFYDGFRVDKHAPTRRPQLGTRTLAISNDGHDLCAALQTIREMGKVGALDRAVSDAFPGARVEITQEQGWFRLLFHQSGLLRPLSLEELSDGTLRYLLLVAALLSPQPPRLLVLNEPETSLHPSLLPALARLMVEVSQQTQVVVVSHSGELIRALGERPEVNTLTLMKERGETKIAGLGLLDEPSWVWPKR